MKRRTTAMLLMLCMLLALLPVSALAAEEFDETTLHYQTAKGEWNGYMEMHYEDATVVFSNAYRVRADVPYWTEEERSVFDYDLNQWVPVTGSYTDKQWVYVIGPDCEITVNDPFWGTDGILCGVEGEGNINIESLKDTIRSFTYTDKGFVEDEEPIVYEGMKGQDMLDLLTAKESEGKLFTMSFYDGIASWDGYFYAAGDSEIPAYLEREKPSAWATEDVNKAISAGLVPMDLRDDYTQPITRAEFCSLGTAVYETYTGKEIETLTHFDDTISLDVEKMAGIGVVNGVGDNLFDPDSPLNREQAATMLARLADKMGYPLEKKPATFADNDAVSDWAIEAVGQMQASGIMGGVGENTFAPRSGYTREQSIITILRLFNLVQAK